MYDATEHTITNWVNRLNKKGVEGLKSIKQPGLKP